MPLLLQPVTRLPDRLMAGQLVLVQFVVVRIHLGQQKFMEGRHAHEVKIFSGTGSQHLAEQIARYHGSGLGDLSFLKFSDGEYQPSINETVRGCDVFFIQSTFPPIDNMMELLMMIDAAKRASAHYITAVIPYFGYARQDRKDKPRVSIGSKLMADLLTAAGASRVMTMDLHAGQIQGFFNIPVDHLDASVIFIPYIQNLGLENLYFNIDIFSIKAHFYSFIDVIFDMLHNKSVFMFFPAIKRFWIKLFQIKK